MLLRVGNAAAVRKGVLLSAACAACAVCAFAKKKHKFAQLVECKRHTPRPWQIEMQLLRCVRACERGERALTLHVVAV